MLLSRIDRTNINLWIASITFLALIYFAVATGIVAAHFPGLGFPCIYSQIVDYKALNMSLFNVMHQVTPQLYLTDMQMKIYVICTLIIFTFLMFYYIISGTRVYLNRHNVIKVNQSTKDIKCIGDVSTCYISDLIMVSFFSFVTSMSFKSPHLSVFCHTIYLILFLVLVIMLTTRYQSFERLNFDLQKLHPKLQTTLHFKLIIINLLQVALAFATLVTVLTFTLMMGNTLYIRTSTVVFSALNVFMALFIVMFLIIEVLLAHYMPMQIGYHFGIFCTLIALSIAAFQYENIYASKYHTYVMGNICVMFIIWFVFMAIRCVRIFYHHKSKYQTLVSSSPPPPYEEEEPEAGSFDDDDEEVIYETPD
ncbi:envelope glycoprotein M [Elephant endotheliotropic herpesvirus 5B]|uniref:Envelope glycoprotein M n=13 Tax=Elephant endotheliotropic herpesvirus 5 TaxID=768738 RepID=A0A075CYB6_9BETA|nr:envelope glycoprotein M [Elephant endotheliotropic herpesvirus 5]AHC02770.1 envelope glycoprotein M [Elephant endotheliotropic herpesvirus 5]UVZ35277.1 envelope glycoprotein M [Elephant endotheliotropic herpesvirus 5B]